MRFDLVTIFPEYFEPLNLSLMGKASDAGVVDIAIHHLRDVTTDRHRTVDDTPFGGGAGMVMRPDIWGRCLDNLLDDEIPTDSSDKDGTVDHLSDDGTEDQGQKPPSVDPSTQRRVLAIPSAAGVPLTQAIVEDLASASHIIVACGRYEGIDQRVADHYRQRDVEVLEFSIGDYVLNGGEVAALVLVEAVARLLDGFMGNPHSLEEESYEGGLLEYPVYTKPREWNSLSVPDVLLSGNHERIRQWRLMRAIERTVERRPDLLTKIDSASLGSAGRERVASLGYALGAPGQVSRLTLREAHIDEGDALADLAARTFPLACPESLPREAIDAFIAEELSPQAFASMLASPHSHRILVAQIDGQLVGYTLALLGEPESVPAGIAKMRGVGTGGAYLSKCYVDAQWQGSGIAGALIERAAEDAASLGARFLVLGTNEANARAQKFYKRHGFRKVGRRTFDVGGVVNRDVVLVRNLTPDEE
ncbi:tRNA (guanosine(37)-N1)-methyltransferase TrmD [Schaalia sp. ZJ1691]|uniref:tRNA (guanosine(37)-N1)-methyltransferase TrmD n=1 Tax=Schaalia sp. ZJ1691 TaxID=2709404 RepID=UPI0013EC66DE|nr:tRNA (guanosine(37)-N1)-methyltransferase TrmD [Schaalia sp. ZJ1691]